MLTYFPTPYPDEWWYSVLCRYYVRSGYHNHATTIRELYGNYRHTHGRLFPNGPACAAILKRLPEGLLDVREILLNHTLLPYYLRFYPLDKKREILEKLCNGDSVVITSITLQGLSGGEELKYCPLCYQEDVEKFGEAYWHREHQIPLMAFCPQHRCPLMQVEVKFARLDEMFLPLAQVFGSDTVGDDAEPNTVWLTLTEILYQYLILPFEMGATPGYNNLQAALIANGYSVHRLDQRTSIHAEKVCTAVERMFGQTAAQQYFSKPSPAVMYRVGKWTLTSPERYALLSALVGLSAEELFGAEIIHTDKAVDRLMSYKKSGVVYRKHELASILEISPHQLDTLANKYEIEAFWKQRANYHEERRCEIVRLTLTTEEKQLLSRAAALSGNGQLAVFVRTIILGEAKKIVEKGGR